MENVLDYLKRKLREAGPSSWDAIATECGIAKTLPRKIAYGDRDNPGVQTVQPLLSYFKQREKAQASEGA
jgi:hypothetical protein